MSLPIEFLAANGATVGSNGFQTSNTLAWTQTTAVTGNKLAAVAYLHVTQASSLSAATVAGTYGGQAMTATKIVYGIGGVNFSLICFRLLNAPAGAQTVSLNISGMTTNLASKQYVAGVAIYRNVYGMTVEGSTNAGGSATVTTRTQAFSNVAPRDVCVGIHGREDGTAFSSYNLNERQSSGLSFSRGLIGDSLGRGLSGTVSSTTTTSVSDHQAAIGLRLIRNPDSGFLTMF